MSKAAVKILLAGLEQGAETELSRSLANVGCALDRVVHAGSQALELLDQESFDFALVNLRLEGTLDGMATAEELYRRQIPVIYVGSCEDAEPWRSPRWGNPCGYLVSLSDATGLHVAISAALRRKQVVQEGFAARNLVDILLRQVHDGIIVSDRSGRVRSISAIAEKATGWTGTEAIGKPVEQICPLKELNGRPLRQHPLCRALDNKSVQKKKRFALADRNGHEIPVEVYASSLCDTEDRILGAVGVFRDITERLQRERSRTAERSRQAGKVVLATESSRTTKAELMALISRAITAQEDERRRVARELHDDLGQRIALLQFEAQRMYRFARVPEVHAGLKRFIEEAERFSDDLRTLSHRLHPSILEELGLGAALRSLVNDYQRQGVDVTLMVGDISGWASLDVRTSLYRITQEALRNAWKHAPAASVHIHLLEKNEQLELRIEDTGPGFDVNLTRATGSLGLLSMQERARLVGGNLLLDSHPNTGTTLMVRVPVRVTA